MINTKHIVAFVLVLCAMSASQTQAQSTPQASANTAKKKQVAPQQHQDEGQRVFEQNCSRCHTAPDGFSPHISGTVLMHMRVRASLSQQDAEKVFRFFNP